MPHDRLLPIVVPAAILAEQFVLDRPSGQCPRGLFHVGLAVLTDSQREQLQELPCEVLVGIVLAIARGVEPDKHGGVTHDGVEQPTKGPPAMLAEQIVLPSHGGQVLYLQVAGGKMIVPQQRQPLAQRIGTE